MIWGYHYLWKHPYDSKPCQTSSLPPFSLQLMRGSLRMALGSQGPQLECQHQRVSNPRAFTKATFTDPNNVLFRKNPQNDHRCLSFDPPNMSNFFMTRFHGSYEFDCLQCFVGGSFCWVLGFSRRIKCRFVQTSVQISNLSASKLKKVTRHAFICGV